MMPDPRRIGLHDDEIEPEAQPRQRTPVGKASRGDHRPGRVAHVTPLPEVDGLLREAERPRAPQPDLDDHELRRRRRARVDRHEIELVATDMDVPGQDRPTLLHEPFRHEGLGVVAEPLRRGAVPGESAGLAVHRGMVPAAAYLAVTPVSPGDCADWV